MTQLFKGQTLRLWLSYLFINVQRKNNQANSCVFGKVSDHLLQMFFLVYPDLHGFMKQGLSVSFSSFFPSYLIKPESLIWSLPWLKIWKYGCLEVYSLKNVFCSFQTTLQQWETKMLITLPCVWILWYTRNEFVSNNTKQVIFFLTFLKVILYKKWIRFRHFSRVFTVVSFVAILSLSWYFWERFAYSEIS